MQASMTLRQRSTQEIFSNEIKTKQYMQAVILAAGMGRRLGELTGDNTKCMLEVNGVKLIDRALEETRVRLRSKLYVKEKEYANAVVLNQSADRLRYDVSCFVKEIL